MGACSSVNSKRNVMRAQPEGYCENPESDESDKAIERKRQSNAVGIGSSDDALLIASLNPAATQFLIGGVATLPHDAAFKTGASAASMVMAASHGIAERSSALAHLASEAGAVALHAMAEFGASAISLGSTALTVAGEAGSSALHAIAEGGSAALSIVSDVGGAVVEHGSAALMAVGDALVVGGSAMADSVVSVGAVVGELASAIS
jgi:hypothetical protein